MPRKYPSGVFNKDHFGIGGIKVKFQDNDKVRLRYGKRQMTVSNKFYESRLDVQYGYRDTEDFFNSFYWGTQAGIREKDRNYKGNFDTAIRSKFETAPTADLQYAVDIWENMSFAERDKFTNENPEWVFQTFKYDEKRARDFATEPEEDDELEDSDTDYDSIYEFLNTLEQYISPNKLARIQRKNRRML